MRKRNNVMVYYFCDCPQSLRIHKDGREGIVAMRNDVEFILKAFFEYLS